MAVTLTWDQDASDVDLHVQEPGTDGRHVKYLAFKNQQTGQEFWVQESRSGVLSTQAVQAHPTSRAVAQLGQIFGL